MNGQEHTKHEAHKHENAERYQSERKQGILFLQNSPQRNELCTKYDKRAEFT